MKNYFVSGIDGPKQQALTKAGVAWCDFALGTEKGILLEETKLDAAAKVMGLRIIADSRRATTVSGVFTVKMRDKNAPPLNVVMHEGDWPTPLPLFTEFLALEIKAMLSPYMDGTLVIHNGRGKQRRPINNNQSHLFLNSVAFEDDMPQIIREDEYRLGSYVNHKGLNIFVHGDWLGKTIGNQLRDLRLIFGRILRVEPAKLEVVNLPQVNLLHYSGDIPKRMIGYLVEKVFRDTKVKTFYGFGPCGNNPRSDTPAPPEDLVIYFYGSSDGLARSKAVSSLFGIPFRSGKIGLEGSCLGEPILDEAGVKVAELNGKELYVLEDVTHRGTEDNLRILQLVLEQTKSLLTKSPKQREAERIARLQEQRQLIRRSYAAHCAKGFTGQVVIHRETVERRRAAVIKLQTDLIEQTRHLISEEKTLRVLEGVGDNDLKFYEQDYDNLLSIPQVTDVKVSDALISVFTSTIYCTDPRTQTVYDIGQFRIDISTSPKVAQECVTWHNLTRKIKINTRDGDRTMDAPHVRQGQACFGNYQKVFPELVAKYEFSTVAQLAIEFVRSVNVGDAWGETINRWPEAKQGTKNV